MVTGPDFLVFYIELRFKLCRKLIPVASKCVLHHRFHQALYICFVLLVRQVTITFKASTVWQEAQSIYKALDRNGGVDHIIQVELETFTFRPDTILNTSLLLLIQVKTVGTPPLSPSTLTSQSSSRRNSIDSTCSSKSSESPTKAEKIERRSSVPADMHLKSVLRKSSSDTKEPRQPLAHRHTVSNIIYEKAPPIKEETRLSPPGGKADTTDVNATKKQLKSILSDKSSNRKNSIK